MLTDANGCTSMGQGIVCVSQLPIASAPVSDVICEGNIPSVGLSAMCSSGTLLWYDSFVDGNQVGAGQNFIPAGASSLSPGVYTYYAGCSQGDCASERVAATLTVTAAPPAPTLPDVTVCDGTPVDICASIFGSANDGFMGFVFPPNSTSMSSALTPDPVTGCVMIPAGDPDYVSGTYTAVYVENGCTSLAGEGTITINPLPSEPVVKTTCVCEGEDAQFTISNVVQGGSYAWSTFDDQTTVVSNNPSPVISSPSNGDAYVVTVTDANGCTSVGQGAVCVSPVPMIDETGGDTICEGSTPAGLTASCLEVLDDAGAPIATTLLWYDSFSGGNQIGTGSPFIPAGASNLAPGTYTYYAECSIGDCAGERVPATLTVLDPAEPSALPDIVVCGSEDVVICPSVFDDAGIEMGMIFPPGSTSMSSALDVVDGCATIPVGDEDYVNGVYTVQYLDPGGCTVTGEGTITINPLPNEPVVKTTCVCDGDDVQFTISNVVQGGSYSWTGPDGYMSNNPSPIVDSLTLANHGDVYMVTVTDANGCTATGEGTVCISEVPTATGAGETICEGITPNGLTAECSNMDGTLLWYDSFVGGNLLGTGESFVPTGASSLSAGSYTYYVACAVGDCEGPRDPVTLIVTAGPEPPTVPDVAVCDGEPVDICLSIADEVGTGNVYVSPPNSSSSGSLIPYDSNSGCYTIDPTNVESYVSGTYSVVYVDGSGCTSQPGEGTITINPLPLDPIIETACVCEGEEATLTVVNADAGSSYSWADSDGNVLSNNPVFTAPDTTSNGISFTVTVTDSNGCIAMGVGTVCILPAPDAPTTDPYVICEGGSADGMGLTADCDNITYWYDSPTGGSPIGEGNVFLPTGYNNLAPGDYTYYAECVVGGCISPRSAAVLTINEGPEAPTVPDVAVCEGDTIAICLSLASEVDAVFVSPPNSGSVGSQIPVVDGCALIASGDEGYVSGAYTVVYVDDNGCTSQPGEGDIVINPLPLEPIVETTCVCNGEDATLTVANADAGSSYSWTGAGDDNVLGTADDEVGISNNPNLTVSEGSPNALYEVTVTNANGCMSVGTGTLCILDQPAPPAPSTFTICEGSLAGADAGLMADCDTGETTYWYDSPTGGSPIGTGNTFLPEGYNELSVGSYTYYAECVVGGCISARTEYVLTIGEGAPAPVVPDVTVCNGEDIALCFSLINDGIAPESIFVSPPNSSSQSSLLEVGADGCLTIAPSDTAYVSGTYTVVYVDANGCTSLPGEGEIVINPLPLEPVIKTECVCRGEDAQLTISNTEQGSSYAWYNDEGDFISNNPAPIISTSEINADSSYVVNDGDVYTVIVTDENGCTSSGDAAVCIKTEPVPPTVMPYEICEGSLTDTDMNGLTAVCGEGETTLWYDSFIGGNLVGEGSPFLPEAYNELTVGTYTFYAECSVGGCISERSPVTLTISEGAPAPIVPDVAVCNGDDIFVCFSIVNDGIEPEHVFVSPPNSSSQSSLIPVDENGCITIEPGDDGYVPGTYVVTYVDDSGCTSHPGEGTIIIYDTPNPPVIKTECVCEGEDVQFIISNPLQGATYAWSGPGADGELGTDDDYSSDNPTPIVPSDMVSDGDVFTVVVTDSNGCESTGSAEACVKPTPTAPGVDLMVR